MLFEWSHVCGDQVDRFSYRLDICLPKGPLDDFKKGGNGRLTGLELAHFVPRSLTYVLQHTTSSWISSLQSTHG
jgi:hypothetical protein